MSLTNIVVYGRDDPHCPYCTKAKQLLDMEGLSYEYKLVTVPAIKEEMLTTLEKYGIVPTTVPQIICDEQYIGGYTELYTILFDDYGDLEY